MDDLLEQFDKCREGDVPSALVMREYLMPVEGSDGVFFPATFAAAEDKTFKGGYNIDRFPDGTNVCLVDSVGAQANRIEPLFASGEYASLVPQIVIVAGAKKVSLLEAGHRAGDAIVRCSILQDKLRAAFDAVQGGDAEPLARIAPTSIVFGVWDSRDTQAKLPRLIASTIRAYDVRELTRSAQYVPAAEYVNDQLLAEPTDNVTHDIYAKRGFVHVPASGSHGGIIATGGIRRDASLHLAALRLLMAGGDPAKTKVLRRYILGLALTAFTFPASRYLRQGCNLVLDPEKPTEFKEVFGDGKREDATLKHSDALAYAKAAAQPFVREPNQTVDFDKDLAKQDVAATLKKTAKAKAPKNK